jgi:hypothetical protein
VKTDISVPREHGRKTHRSGAIVPIAHIINGIDCNSVRLIPEMPLALIPLPENSEGLDM